MAAVTGLANAITGTQAMMRICNTSICDLCGQVRAPCSGTVTALAALAGAQINDGHVLAIVVPPNAGEVAAAA